MRKDIANVWLRGSSSQRNWYRCVRCAYQTAITITGFIGDVTSYHCGSCGGEWRLAGGRLLDETPKG